MDDVVQWHSRRVAACVRWSYFTLIAREETESAGKIVRFNPKSVSAEIPPLDCSIFVCIFLCLCMLETKCPTNRDNCEFPL